MSRRREIDVRTARRLYDKDGYTWDEVGRALARMEGRAVAYGGLAVQRAVRRADRAEP